MRTATSARRLGLTLLGVLSVLTLVTSAFAAVARPDFAVGANPTSQSVQQGAKATYTVTVSGSGGFTGPVTLAASGLPAGATSAFSPSALSLSSGTTSATSTLTVTTARSTPVGSSKVTVTGASGSARRTVTLTLDITYALSDAFTLTAAPTSVTVPAGAPAVYSLTIGRTAGFTGGVGLAAYGSWPAGTSASFTPNPATGGSAELRVTTDAATTPGSYTIWVVGSAPGSGRTQYQYAQTQLVVSTPTGSGLPFTITGRAPAALSPGAPAQPLDLVLTNPNGNKPLAVTNLTVAVSAVTQADPAAGPCPTSDFAVVQYGGAYPLALGAGQTATLTQLGVPSASLPRLQMLNTAVSQDGCKRAGLTLSYSGSARGD